MPMHLNRIYVKNIAVKTMLAKIYPLTGMWELFRHKLCKAEIFFVIMNSELSFIYCSYIKFHSPFLMVY